MINKLQYPILDVSSACGLTNVKGWATDGQLRVGGWTVEHTVQAADELELPAFSEHVLMFSLCSSSTRQFTRFAGQTYEGAGYRKGQFFILPAGHRGEFAWNGEDEAVIFSIQPSCLRQSALGTEAIDPNNIELKPQVVASDDQISFFAYRLLEELRSKREGSALYTESLLTCFSIHLLRYYCTSNIRTRNCQGGLSRRHLQLSKDYIRSHLNEPISLADIAQILNMSSYHFCRSFQQSMGIAPYQYVLQQRVARAKNLLRNSNTSILNVALECGFSSHSQMSRHFRVLVGTTPSRYRKQ